MATHSAIAAPAKSLGFIPYVSIFLVTQITGLQLSLVICYVLKDFIWAFIRMSLINSFILGVALMGTCMLTQRLISRISTLAAATITSSLLLGVAIISFFVVLYSEPALFIYYNNGAIAFLVVNFLFIGGLHIISSGLLVYQKIALDKERAITREKNLKNQMEMRMLSSRINPHFLFNTLNMLLNLLKKPETAEKAILNLSDLLRENLEHSEKQDIPVAQEIENVRKYLELQSLRFGPKLVYRIEGDGDFPVPPLLVQPLVENCIRHNIQKVPSLSVDIVISQDGTGHHITVTDSQKDVDPSMLNRGQGLTITKKRVEARNGKLDFKNGGIEISLPR